MSNFENRDLVIEAGRLLGNLRRQVPGECVICGEPFVGTTKRKYCSHKCAQKAYETGRSTRNARRGRDKDNKDSTGGAKK